MSYPKVFIDLVHQKIHEGNAWTANLLKKAILDDGTMFLRVKTDARTTMHLVLQAEAEGKFYFTTYSDTTYTTPGTGPDGVILTKFNRRTILGKTSGVSLEYEPTIDVIGSLRGNRVILGGTGKKAVGTSGASQAFFTVVGPGEEFLVKLENVSGSTQDCGLVLDWYEESKS